MTKRIGILTSGGDCAGLNATIRAVALRAHHGYGWTTIGIGRGTLGLLERPVEAVTLDPARRGPRKRWSRSPAGTPISAARRAAAPATWASIPRARAGGPP